MSWGEKIQDCDTLLLFLDDWKTRTDIQEEFKLTPIESWSCIKYLKGLTFHVERRAGMGKTKRAIGFRTRRFAMIEIRNSMKEKK